MYPILTALNSRGQMPGRSAALAVIVAGIVFFSASAGADNPWNPWSQIGLFGSNDLQRAEAEAFLPWGNETTLGFLEVRGNLLTDDFDDLELEGNFAIGVRHMLNNGVNLGLWSGADVRELKSNNTFWQVSGGIEVLHDAFDFRANGYAPVTGSRKAAAGSAKVSFSGGAISMSGGREVPMAGYDAEVGLRVPLEGAGLDRDKHELRFFAGAFHFFDDDAPDDIAGPKARLQYQLFDVVSALPGSRLILHGGMRWDDVRHDHWEGGVQLRFPLSWGYADNTPVATAQARQSRRMVEPIARDTDLVTSKSNGEGVLDAITRTPFSRVATVTAGVDTITAVSDATGPDSLLIANGDFTDPASLGVRRTLVGGGTTIAVEGSESGAIGYFSTPGAPATLTHTAMSPITTFNGSGIHLAGFDLTGGGSSSVAVSGNHGVLIPVVDFTNAVTQTWMRDIGQNGIRSSGAGVGDRNLILDRLTVENGSSQAIYLVGSGSGDRSLTATNSTFRDIGSDAIFFGEFVAGNDWGRFDNVEISDIDGTGIYFNGGGGDSVAILRDSSISNTRNEALFMRNTSDGNMVADLENVELFDIDDEAIYLEGSDSVLSRTARLRNVQIRDADSRALHMACFGSGFCSATLDHVSIMNTGSHGLRFSGDGNGNRSFVLDDVQIHDTGSDAIWFSTPSGGSLNVALDDIAISGVVGDGDDALLSSDGGNINGEVQNEATNIPDLCAGTFTGTVDFDGNDAAKITNGVGCVP
jgi:hypothetical protein